MNLNISGPRWATEKLWYVPECSAPADSETPLTFIPTSILRGSMALQSQRSFFWGHPVDGDSLPNVQIYSLLLQVFKKSINQLLLAKVLQQEHRFDKYCILLILMSLLLAMKWHSQFQIDLCNLL